MMRTSVWLYTSAPLLKKKCHLTSVHSVHPLAVVTQSVNVLIIIGLSILPMLDASYRYCECCLSKTLQCDISWSGTLDA